MYDWRGGGGGSALKFRQWVGNSYELRVISRRIQFVTCYYIVATAARVVINFRLG